MRRRFSYFLVVLCLMFSSLLYGCANGTVVIEWKCPKVGMTPDSFETAFPPTIECNGHQVSFSKLSWTDISVDEVVTMDPIQDTFTSGHTYQVMMELEIPSGVNVDVEDVVSTTKGFRPEKTVKTDSRHFTVSFWFSVDEEGNNQEDVLSISCSMPAIGMTVGDIEKKEAVVLFNGKKLDATYSDWRIYDLKRSNDGEILNSETSFDIGHYYSVLLSMSAPSSYSKEYTVIRSDMEILQEDAVEGQINIRVFFDQLAYRIDSPEIMIRTLDLRDGVSVKDINKQMSVSIGDNSEDEVSIYWYKRLDGNEILLSDRDTIRYEERGEYLVDIQFPIGKDISDDEFSLQVVEGNYLYHTGLMVYTEDGQRYGNVRIVYESNAILPSLETMAAADVVVNVPCLIGKEDFYKINEEVRVSALNREVEDVSIQWSAYVGNILYPINSKADVLDGYYGIDGGNQKVDYYLMTVDFPMVSLGTEEVKLSVDCEGLQASWISFWEDEEKDTEMAEVLLLVNAQKIIHEKEPHMGVQNAFLYVPQVLAGNTPEQTNSHFMLMINGIEVKDYNIKWIQGVDENEDPIVLAEEDVFQFGENEDAMDVVLSFESDLLASEEIGHIDLGTYGIDSELVAISVDEESKNVRLTIHDIQNGKAFVKVTGPTAYIGAPISFDPEDYKVVWMDEYQNVELDLWRVEWRSSDSDFDPETAGSEEENSLWEGETFNESMNYVADLFAATPENRNGTEIVSVYAGPHLSLMSANTPVSWMIMWEEEVNMVRAHLGVNPVSSGVCLQHSFVINEDESIQATCSSEGLRVSYCEYCNVKKEEVISKTDHERTYNSAASRPANCAQEGVDVYECVLCGEEWEEISDRLDHVMQYSATQSTEATCQHAGSEVSICSNCGFRSTRIIPKKDHSYRKIEEGTSATCESMGTVIYECRMCGDRYSEYTRALGHKYEIDLEKSHSATCTKEGTRVTSCTVCGKQGDIHVIPALGHDYHRDNEASKPATATEDGVEVQVCSRCSDIIRTTVPKLPDEHVHDYEEIRIASTCVTQGSVTRRCKVCGHEDANVEILPLTSHNFDFIGVGLAPSCFEDGYNLVKCSICGKEEREAVPAYGDHAMKLVPEESSNATCTHDGVEVYRCTHARCDHEERLTIPQLPHNYTVGGNANGTHTHTCSNCGTYYTEPCNYVNDVCDICGDHVINTNNSSDEVVG